MTKSIRTKINQPTIDHIRHTTAHELTQLIGGNVRSYIQDATAAAGHKITTTKLRKILTGETDPTILDVLAIAHALEANALPAIVRIITAATVETTKEDQ
ncbi:hypothetical protein [Rothia nasimurium]|uniref:hypothetical protein n=1 Tax=Rothia nasimurium TaxID=85336 RepID=UPI003BA3DA92